MQVVLTTDVDRLEALYAQGQKVKAIHECREIAIHALPGHAARLQTELDKHSKSAPGTAFLFETFLYRQNKCEDANAAMVVAWCAKWLVGMDDTRTEYELGAVRKTPIGDMRERISRTVVIRGREDFAANAFIALRMMAGPARPVQRSDSNEQRQDARLARLRALGGDRVYGRSGWRTTGDGALAKLEAEIKAARNKPFSEKSIRKDLTEAATRVQEAKRSGPFNGLVPR